MPHDQQAMQSYYGARAPEYDHIYLKPERQSDLAAIQSWLPPKCADATLLEIACGTGYWTQFLAPVATEVVAIDSAPETLAIARARITAPKARFLLADAYALPADLGAFDVAFAGFWFSHIPKARRREFLTGLAACLLPGARVVFLDNLYVEGSSSPITDYDQDGNAFQTRRLADGSVNQVLKNFPTESELLECVATFGECALFTRWQYFWALEFAFVKR
jgi:ubiquinone/menaquinone biosynthesis C-methylase UbiE